MKKKTSIGSWLLGLVVVLVVAVLALYLTHKASQRGATAMPSPSAGVQPPASTSSSPLHPIAQAAVPAVASTAALPPLGSSDTEVVDALVALAGEGSLRELLVSTQVVARIVATIDALPRHALGTLMLPAHPPKGGFATAEANGQLAMAAENSERYAPYIEVMKSVDPAALVAWYAHAYPLFQQAYQELGYPHGYFNDRLIEVIDHLLAAPELAQPALLQRVKSHYAFADPSLESLSAGQKLLLRTGPANEALIKAKLRAIRAALIGTHLPATGRSVP
ncbi:MAG TPA: DUF3014 domain-containing protein [Rhodanobacter sp.]|nr:DUF3014 domain-containing protein [Rhodanobacter sp.]